MVNHGSDADVNTDWTFNEYGDFIMVANRDIDQGQQIVDSYGGNNPAELFVSASTSNLKPTLCAHLNL
jgi:hypothetical protein